MPQQAQSHVVGSPFHCRPLGLDPTAPAQHPTKLLPRPAAASSEKEEVFAVPKVRSNKMIIYTRNACFIYLSKCLGVKVQKSQAERNGTRNICSLSLVYALVKNGRERSRAWTRKSLFVLSLLIKWQEKYNLFINYILFLVLQYQMKSRNRSRSSSSLVPPRVNPPPLVSAVSDPALNLNNNVLLAQLLTNSK